MPISCLKSFQMCTYPRSRSIWNYLGMTHSMTTGSSDIQFHTVGEIVNRIQSTPLSIVVRVLRPCPNTPHYGDDLIRLINDVFSHVSGKDMPLFEEANDI